MKSEAAGSKGIVNEHMNTEQRMKEPTAGKEPKAFK